MKTKIKRKKVVLSFSGGKDSVLSLYKLLNNEEYEVIALLTTLDANDKVLMHGFDFDLLDMQAQSLGITLRKIIIPSVNYEGSLYAEKMKEELEEFRKNGVTHVAFGDIYLEDVRKFREDKLSMVGMTSIFPLWGKDTKELSEEFVRLGFQSVITCVNTKLISKDWIGAEFNEKFITYLIGKNIDPCGENGEFHTFVYAGPIFKEKLNYKIDFEHPLIHNEFYACIAKKSAAIPTI